jgi:hypothetical protein
LTAGSDRVSAAKMVSTCRFDASTGKARYGARRLAKPERRPRRAPAISRVECGSGGAWASSPAPELGFGAEAAVEDMAAAGRRERRRGVKRRVEATNGDGVGAAAAIRFVSSLHLGGLWTFGFLCFSSCLESVWQCGTGRSH